LDLDLALQALEAVAVGVTEILVEGDAIIIHFCTPVLPAPRGQLILSSIHVR
jgi:hypothetical protein